MSCNILFFCLFVYLFVLFFVCLFVWFFFFFFVAFFVFTDMMILTTEMNKQSRGEGVGGGG